VPQLSSLPPGIGPHEERECELMLAGKKPLAMFCDADCDRGYFPEEIFAPYVAVGIITQADYRYESADGRVAIRCLFFAQIGQEWRINEAHAIQEAIFSGSRKATEADDIRLGQLLGYSDSEIQAFTDHVRHSRYFRKQSAQSFGE
jgi:hypothetical protein